MKLFLKHLFRTLKKSPLQPLLILLTVTMSVSVAINSYALQRTFNEELRIEYNEKKELGDILLELNPYSSTRWIFDSKVKEKVGDKGEVYSDFKLTVFCGKAGEREIIDSAATDFKLADSIYKFKFKEYGKFTEENLDTSIIISEEFSRKHSLKVGDILSLNVLGTDRAYTVQAVAKDEGILLRSDILISVTGITKIIKSKVPAVAILGDNFTPCNRITVKLDNTEDLIPTVNTLKNTEEFNTLNIINTHDKGTLDFNIFLKCLGVFVLAMITVMLSALLVTTSMKLVEEERTHEYILFESVGATDSQINSLKWAETLLYSILGSTLGAFIAYPLYSKSIGAFNFNPERNRITPDAIIFGFALSILAMGICTFYHIYTKNKKSIYDTLNESQNYGTTVNNKEKIPVLLLITTSVLSLALILIPKEWKFPIAFITAVLFTVVAYKLTRIITLLLSKAYSKIKTDKRHKNPILFLTTKSLENKPNLRHVSSLITALVMMVVTVVTVGEAVKNESRKISEFIDSDFIGAGLSQNTVNELKANPDISSMAELTVFTEVQIAEKYSGTVISAFGDTDKCLNVNILPKEQPKGNEVAIYGGLAKILKIKVGDDLKIRLQGVDFTLKVSEVVPNTANLLFIDSKALGIPTQYLLMNLNYTTDKAKAEEKLTGFLETRGSVLISEEEWVQKQAGVLPGFLSLIDTIVTLSTIIAAIGIINVSWGEIKSSKSERKLLHLQGMTKTQIGIKTLTDYTIISLLALTIGSVSGIILTRIINQGIFTFGFTIFL